MAELPRDSRTSERVGLTEARRRLGELVTRVHLDETSVILEKGGIPVAVILSVQEFRALQAQKNGDRDRGSE